MNVALAERKAAFAAAIVAARALPLTFGQVAEALESQQWIFAKTMPHIPHWYCLRNPSTKWPRGWDAAVPFEAAIQFIRDHSYAERFGKTTYYKMNVNGFKYWTMGASLPSTILINRAVIDAPAAYDPVADRYDAMWSTEEALAENREVIRRIEYAGGPVLDIGCGTGLLLDYLPAAKGPEYLGIDPSRAMLARHLAKHNDGGLIATSFESFWTPRKFALVTALFGVASYIDPAILWERLPDLLAPGGRFFLMFCREDYAPVTHGALENPPPLYPARPMLGEGKAVLKDCWIETGALGNFVIVRGGLLP